MAGDAFFDFACAQAVAGDVDHVVGAAQNEEVAVLVAHAPVEGAVNQLARNTLPVGLEKPDSRPVTRFEGQGIDKDHQVTDLMYFRK